jgi:uridine kinase
MKPVIIGVAGGTGSGKTTVVREIVRRLGQDDVAVVQHDSYYRDRSSIPATERARINYDHPDALETPLLVEHLKVLLEGGTIEVPVYDFSTHTRTAQVVPVAPHKVVIVEGILVLAEPELRALMSIRVFVDTDADIRMIRRLRRDMRDRARTLESVVEQYQETVRPMHLEFVEPSKRHAHVIIPEGGENFVAVDMLVSRIEAIAHGEEITRGPTRPAAGCLG